MLRHFLLIGCLFCCGCAMLPEISRQPTLHNPLPELSKVAVAPFFNLSQEPTVDGRGVAEAYFNELQSVPGFEVIPVGVVENAMRAYQIDLNSPTEARRLAQLLEADALVVGAVTDYSPWYPPRLGLQVQWHSANPCFHPIPPGYGLPWGTPEEEGIPGRLVFEAELALAKAQLRTQTPDYEPLPKPQHSPDVGATPDQEVELDDGGAVEPLAHLADAAEQQTRINASEPAGGLPADWPDPRGFVPPPPQRWPPICRPTEEPVLQHTSIYNGNDHDFTEALATYCRFRDDARFGGAGGYLQRSDDFIRFCCHMHVWEMLSARGGAGETRVVWRWPTIR